MGEMRTQMDDVGQAIGGRDMSVEENMRERILEVLDFLADAGAQRAYQARAPSINVSNELFSMWDDCYPVQESALEHFTSSQLAALERFNETLEEVADATPVELPPLLLFMESQHWKRLNQAAERALEEVRSTGIPRR